MGLVLNRGRLTVAVILTIVTLIPSYGFAKLCTEVFYKKKSVVKRQDTGSQEVVTTLVQNPEDQSIRVQSFVKPKKEASPPAQFMRKFRAGQSQLSGRFIDGFLFEKGKNTEHHLYIKKEHWTQFWRNAVEGMNSTSLASGQTVEKKSTAESVEIARGMEETRVFDELPLALSEREDMTAEMPVFKVDDYHAVPEWYINLVKLTSRDFHQFYSTIPGFYELDFKKRERLFKELLDNKLTAVFWQLRALKKAGFFSREIGINDIEAIDSLALSEPVKAVLRSVVEMGIGFKLSVSGNLFTSGGAQSRANSTDLWMGLGSIYSSGGVYRNSGGKHQIELNILNTETLQAITGSKEVSDANPKKVLDDIVKLFEETIVHEGFHALSRGNFRVEAIADLVLRNWGDAAQPENAMATIEKIIEESSRLQKKTAGVESGLRDRVFEGVRFASTRMVMELVYFGFLKGTSSLDALVALVEQIYEIKIGPDQKKQIFDYLSELELVIPEMRKGGREAYSSFFALTQNIARSFEMALSPDQRLRGRILSLYFVDMLRIIDEVLAQRTHGAVPSAAAYGFFSSHQQLVIDQVVPDWSRYVDVPEVPYAQLLE